MKIMFLSKDNRSGRSAQLAMEQALPDAHIEAWLAGAGERLPQRDDWSCDYLISYLCPRIIPRSILARAGEAINFHPAPPEYPGFGCYNFAIYDGASEYGATCHRMVETVDSGEILAVRRFAMADGMTAKTLQERTLEEMHVLFVEVLEKLRLGESLKSGEEWARPPTTRADFEALRQVPLSADATEIARRVRAFVHPDHHGAYLRLHGFDFVALAPGDSTR